MTPMTMLRRSGTTENDVMPSQASLSMRRSVYLPAPLWRSRQTNSTFEAW
jgi:hypothetical protein